MNLRQMSQLFYKLKLANQEMTTKFEKETGFSITRYELMMFLKENGQCSQGQLQNELKIDSAAITRHLKLLEAKGYVTRERNKQNNREVFVKITDSSKEALERCERNYNNSSEKSLELALTTQEEGVLLALLTKLLGHKGE
ncbi:MarR family winged helix-turn-helix transcriptional regulator [Lactococcus formosensis]|uniref:MarR family transcriptional regulator n=1 Tax=Lactococcus formosensis TaxID=1281486 RepID=A0A9X4P150_9LACT|nr:MarR family transcriptional regulator [Lactococcus formosensis]MDG6111504.1 MarR family transcriptional regulator [Lactococcus formosensis]MDG6118575.1 MarR family transcriptional regulator [Lactococcus formosensis]MDG6127229.1 MarR family transcriptional regulator [Lactococcus formosensis]MDG6133520.1 MarR family transcriptional regulator [Lactococcus formosensis]MDG6135487.1 MarR family transcriptional regulator [Lactococcus formosensis]